MRNFCVVVLMATFNGEKWLAEQIESVLGQDGVDIKLYISDDGSTDGTVDIIRGYESAYDNVKFLGSAKYGSASRNFFSLIRQTSVDSNCYYAFCDQDDVWLSCKLMVAVQSILDNQANGYSCATMPFDESGSKSKLVQCPIITEYDYFFEGAGQGCTFVFDSSLLSEMKDVVSDSRFNSFNIHYHDWLLYLLSRVGKYKWLFDESYFVMYRQHGSNDTGSKYSINGLLSRFRLIRNGWYSDQLKQIINCSSVFFPNSASSVVVERMAKWASVSLISRVKFALFLFFCSRRRLSDRVVLGFSELFGWISSAWRAD